MQAQQDGILDSETLTATDREHLLHFKIPVTLAWVTAMLDWPAIEPADLRCPTLWIAGAYDEHAMDSILKREESLKDSMVQVHVVDGLDHNQLSDTIDKVLPIMVEFTNQNAIDWGSDNHE
jgi:pimeloyl-ACP methyl ester carboxylesterase